MMEKLLKILVFLTILLAPLYIIRWEYFGVLPTTLLEFLIWGVLGIWGIWKIQRRDLSWPKTPLDKPILLFLTAAVISFLITPDLRGGLGIFKAYFVEPILFFYILTDLMKRRVIGKIWVIRAMMLSGLWLSILGILQALTGQFVFASHEIGRAHGVFNSGNALALYLGPTLVLALNHALRLGSGQGFLGKNLGWGIWGVTLLAFILTQSQGGWVALVATLGLWLLAKALNEQDFTKVLKSLFFLLPASCFLLLITISYFTPKNVANPWQRSSASTLQVRLCVWEGTRNLLLEHPISGAGLSGFKELYSQKYFTCDTEPLEYPHNLFLTLWAEMGLMGLTGLIWILYVLFFQLSSFPALQLSIFYLLIHGLVDVPYFKNDLSLQFWVLAALILWFSYWDRGKD